MNDLPVPQVNLYLEQVNVARERVTCRVQPVSSYWEQVNVWSPQVNGYPVEVLPNSLYNFFYRIRKTGQKCPVL